MKSGVECIFRVPAAPRRRKKRTQEEILKARLSQYEEILRSKGIDVHKDDVRPEDLPDVAQPFYGLDGFASGQDGVTSPIRSGGTTSRRAFAKPKLIVDHGGTRFVENSLWSSVAEEFVEPGDAMPDSSDDDTDSAADDSTYYVIGETPSSMAIRNLHPLPEQVTTLWQVFLDNINPLSKLIHMPSLQPAIIEASAHLDRIPRNLEALLFAIYSMAVSSLMPDECQSMLGESKAELCSRYITGTKRALARAKFLGTSDIMVLQAFVLHLLCTRHVYDSKTLWTLTGVGARIAEGMGCHRDGSSLGLGPFETEMRRRIWWQLVFLEFRTAELTGSGHYGNIGQWDVRLPSNVNDADIWPGMKESPEPQERGTEMIFCLTRYELGHFWRKRLLTRSPGGDFATLWSNFRQVGTSEEKIKGIEELEQSLEHKYVRYCDPSVPVEFMAILVTRAATNGMRLMAHHPRRYAKDADVPESERKILWSTASRLLEIDNLLHASKHMNRFRWHTDSYFQWQGFIYVLTELRRQPLHEQVDHGWRLVGEVYENHPSFVTDIKKPINYAVGNLCLKAWKAREETWSQRAVSLSLHTPEYVHQLRKDRVAKQAPPVPEAPHRNEYYDPQQTISAVHADLPIVSAASNLHINDSQQQVNLSTGVTGMLGQEQVYQQPFQQTELPNQLHNPQQNLQQPQDFWWHPTGLEPQPSNTDFDFNTLWPDFGLGQNNMDWMQWDSLLKQDIPP
ncbi:hypothetical protein OHC33_002064 [Knufia fluminis]|uniref:Xylanolytic transcriptional activator regulatory domain-containing protein n=1 Tax=Knufia fluminis TaxID=191047 RepID=A0AAN8F4P1_9EURO|nr:hypothetical protein OHC33_002064 [Knufia fluminis]